MRRGLAAAAVVLAVAVTACHDKKPSTARTSETSVASPTSSTSQSTTTVIPIVVAAGKVVTKDRIVKVAKGTNVVITVTSDVADEVHVHGYDIKKDVAAGATIEIPFVADQTGSFPVELEKASTQLISLQVR
jgi:type III secretion system FlhB-like substrate exporter